MKKLIGAAALSLLAGVSMAQTTVDNLGVTTSTDPAKVAAVQRHAAELQQHNQGMSEKQDMATNSTSHSMSSGHKAAHRHQARHGHHRAKSTATSNK